MRAAVAVASIFFAASFVLLPRTFLYLGAGAAFGSAVIPVALAGTTVGGLGAFFVSRWLLSKRIERFVGSRPLLKSIAAAIDDEGWKIVGLMRFASPIPSAVQNYVFGITRIGVVPFTVATFVFTLPQTLFYVYLGSAGRSAFIESSTPGLNQVAAFLGVLSLGLIGFLVWRKARILLQTAVRA
jgi:uncharacterized membrane protein YdjX (TVP38/TMEM64 family)